MYKNFFILTSLLFLSSCSQPEVKKNSIAMHIDQNNKLYIMMHSLNSSIYKKNRSELEIDDAKRRYALNIATNIKQSSNLLNRYGKKNLKNDNLKNFFDLNEQLLIHASKIELIANNYEMEKLDNEIERLNNICTSCHIQFRGYR